MGVINEYKTQLVTIYREWSPPFVTERCICFLLFLVIAVWSIVPSVTGEQSTSALKIQTNFKWRCLDSNGGAICGIQDD